MRRSDGPKKQRKYKPDTVRAAFHRFFVGEESEDGEQRAFCPICEDPDSSASPSASFNPDEGVWNCLKGNHGGSIVSLVADLKKERGFDIRRESMRGRHADPSYSEKTVDRLKEGRKKASNLPTDEQINNWTSRLLSGGKPLTDLMSQRGFNKDTIVTYNLGWDGSRYTIPVFDENGELANVRRYKLNARSHNDKMLNIPGCGSARIYGIEDIQDYDTVVMTEGETDRIILKQAFRISGIEDVGVATHTAGAGTFRTAWGSLFTGKKVFFCYDNDDVGKRGSAKARNIAKLYAEETYILTIPLQHKGADITDFIHKEGHSAEDFLLLMKEAEEKEGGTSSINVPVPDSGKVISLLESMSQENQNEVLELVVSVAGKQAEPFTAPKEVSVTCDMDKGAACSACPIAARNGEAEFSIRPDDEQIFRFIDTTEQRRRALLREISGARCNDRVTYETPEDYHIEELLVQPSVDERRDDETQLPIRRTIFSVSTYKTAVNEKLRIVGRNVPDPKTGKLRFMAWHNESVEMDIDKFELTPEIRKRLEIFQPDDSQSPLDKCLEIAEDMSENVTHIYGREVLHVAYDLVWHSVQSFKIGDRLEQKGWLEAAVVGDTRTGKSEIASRLIKHYKSGTLLSCEGMSFAGIVGGVQQIDGRWHLTWGAVPMNDRRMVILDEMSGLKDKDVIDQMSSIRSSGVAQITKISSEQTSARTRLMWISNPADGGMLADFPDAGMDALRTIVPKNEDIARFDFVIAAAKGEVPAEVINSGFSERHSPEFKSQDCEMLIKWAWSLTRNDVLFTDAAAKQSNKAAIELGKRYIPDPPLIQGENVRFKILRIAAAIAARTFSVNKAGKLMVQAEHVKDAVRFIDMVYGTESMGYQRKSRRTIIATKQARDRRAACMTYLKQNPDTILMTLQMVGGKTFKPKDFLDFTAMTADEGQIAVQRLLGWRMVHKRSRGEFGMDPVLLSILREIEDEEYEA